MNTLIFKRDTDFSERHGFFREAGIFQRETDFPERH
jgi:hypothetical protein